MDGRTDGQMDGRTDGLTDGQMDGRTDKRTILLILSGVTNKKIYRKQEGHERLSSKAHSR